MPRTVIVVPCYNESQRIDVARYCDFLDQQAAVDLLLVDDGSRDGTLSVLRSIQTARPRRVDVLPLARNGGKAEAVRQGMLAALQMRPDFAGFWDADLATPFEAVFEFLEVLQRRPGVEAVIGSRVALLGHAIQRKRLRAALSQAFSVATSCVLGVKTHDTQCGAKLFRCGSHTGELFERPFQSRWVFDVEILARLAAQGRLEQRVYELPLHQWRDVGGSKLRPWHFMQAALDLWSIWRGYASQIRGGRELTIDGQRSPRPETLNRAA